MNIGGIEVTISPKTIEWDGPLSRIDADGSPIAYHPAGCPPGLDHLANAGPPKGRYGIIMNPDGTDYIDPDTGFCVSCTALVDPTKSRFDPTRYVDATRIPYMSVPPELLRAGARLGDLGLIVFESRIVPVVLADVGPHRKLTECSMAAAQALGIASSPVNGGSDTKICHFTIFIGSNRGWPRTPADIGASVVRLAA